MQLRKLTKHLMALLLLAAAALEDPRLRSQLLSQAAGHPHLLSMLSFLIPALLLLHNPTVVSALGLKVEQTTTSTEVVPIDPPASTPSP